MSRTASLWMVPSREHLGEGGKNSPRSLRAITSCFPKTDPTCPSPLSLRYRAREVWGRLQNWRGAFWHPQCVKGEMELTGAESAPGDGRSCLRLLDKECLRVVCGGCSMSYGTRLDRRDRTLGFQYCQQLAPVPRDRKCLLDAKH